MIAILPLVGLLLIGASMAAAESLVFPGTQWEEATPESQGVDGAKLADATSLLASTLGKDGARELVIIRNGRMIWKGDDIDKRHGVWSATKSFTSTVLGLLIEDGKCTLDTRLADVLPELKRHYPDATLRHFTTMTSGYRAVGDETTGSYKHGPSNTPFQPNPKPLFTPPGSQYAYWDSAMNTFGLALTKIAGEPIEDLFRRRIAQPIGMRGWDWGDYATVEGVVVNGGSGNGNKHIFITAREMARFGLLFLNQGNWSDRQLVSAKWISEATRVQVPASMPWAHPESDIDGRGVYGFNWWRNGVKPDGARKFPGAPEGMFWASGHNNNKCFVIPEWNMVIVRLGLDGQVKDEVWNAFLAKVGEALNVTGEPQVVAPPHQPLRVIIETDAGGDPAGPGEPPSPQTAIAGLIQAAGTTHDELERLRLLRQLDNRPDLNATLRADLAKLLPVVDDWANGKSRIVVDSSRAAENGYLCRFITGRTRPATDGPVHPPELSDGSPLRPIWCFYRGRMLIWQVIQSSPLLSVKERREKYYGEARRLLRETRQAFPENRVVRMYLGEPIPWPASAPDFQRSGVSAERRHPPTHSYPADPLAPAWANLQREGLEKLADVIHWWIAERQLPDGQFGGGWGDDVEMWRWWIPVMIAFDDPIVSAAQERISSGIFRQAHLREGFTSRVTDVEHSNEDTTDTILPMMHLRPDDPVWKERALRLAELMRERWTGRNERGFLQFKSIYFSVAKVDTNAARAFDTVYHPSIIQPTLLYWQRTGDPALTALFGEWLKVWVDATARAENGKPAGVLPSAIRWPDGGIAKAGPPWWEPFSIGHNDALYNWPGATRLMTSTLLLAHHITREEKYLEPIRSMAALRAKHLNSSEGEPGSETWSARRMSGFLPDALAKYRLLTGDTQYDALLRTDASGYVRYRLTGDAAPLEAALRRNAEAFRSNWEAYTSEMRWTDRVMSFTRNFLTHLPEPAPPAPSPEILHSSATGDPGNPLVFPMNAVRWRTPPREIAALVTESSRTSFAAELFHFGAQPRDLDAELFLLSPGEYELTLTVAGAEKEPPLQQQAVRVKGPRVRVSLQLPARRLCVVKVVAR